MNRKQKREAQRLELKVKTRFTEICENFASEYLHTLMDPNEEKLIKLYEVLETKWLKFAREIIKHNATVYNQVKTRQRLLSGFENFVSNFYENMKDKSEVNNEVDK